MTDKTQPKSPLALGNLSGARAARDARRNLTPEQRAEQAEKSREYLRKKEEREAQAKKARQEQETAQTKKSVDYFTSVQGKVNKDNVLDVIKNISPGSLLRGTGVNDSILSRERDVALSTKNPQLALETYNKIAKAYSNPAKYEADDFADRYMQLYQIHQPYLGKDNEENFKRSLESAGLLSNKVKVANTDEYKTYSGAIDRLQKKLSPEEMADLGKTINTRTVDYVKSMQPPPEKNIFGPLGSVLSIASYFMPALAPFAAMANTANAIQTGNPLAGIASLTGIPGIGQAANAAGLGSLVSGLQTANQANNLVRSLQSGNALGAIASGVNLAGAGGAKLGDTGYKVSDALRAASIADALNKGNPLPLIGSLAKSATSSGPSPADFEEGSFGRLPGRFDPNTYGLIDTSIPAGYTPTTDYSVGANYDLFPGADRTSPEMGGAQGIKSPSLPDIFGPDGEIDYSLFRPTATGGEPALKMPKTPNLPGMGGGQGLTTPAAGGQGTMTGAGLIPDDYLAALGDPDSFINKPAPGADVSAAVQKAIAALSKAPTTRQPQQPQQNLQDLLAMQSPQMMQAVQTVYEPIYGKGAADFDPFAPLDVNYLGGRDENQGSQPGRQATKISSGGYMDDLIQILKG